MLTVVNTILTFVSVVVIKCIAITLTYQTQVFASYVARGVKLVQVQLVIAKVVLLDTNC